MLKERLPFEYAIEKKGEASSPADGSMNGTMNLVPITEHIQIFKFMLLIVSK